MSRYDDIHPNDIDPDTGRPFAGYSSPSLDTSFHDHEMAVDDPPEVELGALLKQWKCACTDGFYLQRERGRPIGQWVVCRRCNGSGLDPKAEQALRALQRIVPDGEDERPIFDEDDSDRCTNPRGHSWVHTGTAYGGDDERWYGEGRCYCEHCGADGDA